MRLNHDQPAHAYARALDEQAKEYAEAVASGRFKPVAYPWSNLNIILLVVGLYVAMISPLRISRFVRTAFFLAVLSASAWNIFHYRSPAIVDNIIIGLNAVMTPVFAVNFLLLRDPQQIARATLVRTGQTKASDSNSHIDTSGKATWTWQNTPAEPLQRLYWILDLLACLRALKWSWTSPRRAQKQLPSPDAGNNAIQRHLIGFICSYLALDIIKCVMIADPHFLGDVGCSAPAHLTFLSPLLLHTYRMLLPALGITSSIQFYCSAWALFQMKVLGPRILGINGQGLMFPPLYGSLKAVYTHGLRGFWGRSWHQIFRAHFDAIGTAVSDNLISPRSGDSGKTARTAIRLTVAFALSGLFHACGNYTVLAATRPLNVMAFFSLQPIGIAVQTFVPSIIHTRFLHTVKRRSVHGPANTLFALFWLWGTWWLLADDFCRAGMWLFEPVPVSVVRGLGFSAQDKDGFRILGLH